MKYLLVIKTDINEAEIFEFKNEFQREDMAYTLDIECPEVQYAYTQDNWIVDDEPIFYIGHNS